MLLVYDAASVQHTEYVKATKKILQNFLGIDLLLDTLDVPRTDHKSPPQWYMTEMERADLIAFILPPRILSDQCRGSPFHNTYQLCLNVLESNLKNMSKISMCDKYLAFVLPDSDPTFILPFSKFMTRFQIPYDCYPLRQHIQLNQSICRVRLPRWLLFNNSRNNSEFFRILEKNPECEEQIPFLSHSIDSDIQNNQEEEFVSIERKTKQLDDIFGNVILRVSDLKPVIHPASEC